jgi:hypothetical protein
MALLSRTCLRNESDAIIRRRLLDDDMPASPPEEKGVDFAGVRCDLLTEEGGGSDDIIGGYGTLKGSIRIRRDEREMNPPSTISCATETTLPNSDYNLHLIQTETAAP